LVLTTVLPLFSADTPEPAWKSGNLTVKPSGFLEVIGMSRSQTTSDSVSTHFGAIPLTDTPAETIASPAHSRVMLKSAYTAGSGAAVFSVYLESDFLNSKPDSAPWRWRQYWGALQTGKWELLGGQAWSLMRPNRTGIQTEKDLMSTYVVDPAYHVGLTGLRRRQVRLTRSLGRNTAAVDWESNGDFEGKWALDVAAGHFEAAGLAGRGGRRALQLSAVKPVGPRLRLVSQQFVARHALNEALGLVANGVSGVSTLSGAEFQTKPNFQLHSYGGLLYSERSAGNRLARQYSMGISWRKPVSSLYGFVTLTVQYSYLDRAIWDGRSGKMQFLMYRMRYTIL
jgi:hypothetical protein